MANIFITTSWDDGHPLDLQLAAVLARRRLRGTFYIPAKAVAGEVVGVAEMRELLAMGMEIGSHTVTHPILTEVTAAEAGREMRDSRRMLEDALGIPITSFCYPRGKFNRALSRQAAGAGYRVCRTTVDFETSLRFDPLRMPVSLQLFPHKRWTHYRHTARRRNWPGLWNWQVRFGGVTDVERLVSKMLASMRPRGGLFHLWGHSWEIERYRLWPLLDRVTESLSTISGAAAVTNGEVLEVARS